MTNGEVVESICGYVHEFFHKYKNSKLNQKVIDAILVEFINTFAEMCCGIDLAMHTRNLRDKKETDDRITTLQKGIIYPYLISCKKECEKAGIIESINKNSYMNECDGKANADNAEAVKLINEFIKGYMAWEC